MQFKVQHKHFLWLLLAIVAVYANIAVGPFIFDDDTFVVKNTYLHSLNDIPRLYRSCMTEGAFIRDCNFYRPNQALAHALVYNLFGANATCYHVLSILVHLFNCLLIYALLKQLNFNSVTAFFCSLLFAVHPMQTEAISYISGLSDPLALCFMLITIVAILKAEKNKLWILVSIVSGIMAMLSKESAFTLCLLIPLMLFASGQKKLLQTSITNKFLMGIFLILSATYVYLKLTVFDFTGNNGLTGEDNVYTQSIFIRMITFITIIPEYLQIIFIPLKLFIERPYTAYDTIFTKQGFVGLLAVASIGYLLYHSYKKNNTKLIAGILWFMICIAPLSGIVPLNAIYLEHWLYIPSVGLILLLATVTDNYFSSNKNNVLPIAFIGVALLFSARTIARNEQWKDPIKFYANEIKNNPKSARCYNNLAMAYADKKNNAKAIENYLKAIKLYDVYPQTHHNLANVYLAIGDVDKAVQQFFTAIYMDPGFVYSYEKLVVIYDQYGNKNKAQLLNQALIRAANHQPITREEVKVLYEMK